MRGTRTDASIVDCPDVDRPQASLIGRGAALLAAVSVWALSAVPLYAQGCAMCREAAASQKAGAIAALNSGILILGAPVAAALFIFSRLLRRYAGR